MIRKRNGVTGELIVAPLSQGMVRRDSIATGQAAIVTALPRTGPTWLRC